jgi:hypothetical protein
MGGVISGIGSVISPIIGGIFNQGPSGTSPAGNFLGGTIASQMNKPQGQTSPGAFYPQGGQGLAYNYIPTGQAGMDQAFLNQMGYQGSAGLNAQQLANPMMATLLRNIMNDPSMAQNMAAAQRAGGMASAAAQPTYNAGTTLQNQMLAALPQFQQILQQGTDPQSALYNRTLAQTRDQMGAGLASQGLAGSGVGGAIENQGLSNFNIDWQNQQLARALSAMQGYGGAMGQAGQTLGQGQALQGAGIQEALQGGQLPYLASQQNFAGQNQGLSNYLNNFAATQNIGNQNLGQMLAYLQAGQQANQLAANQAAGGLSGVQAQNAAASAALSPIASGALSGIGSGLSSLFNLFGGSNSTGIPSGNPLYAGGYSGGLGAGTTAWGADY